jgi:hypothetical protein
MKIYIVKGPQSSKDIKAAFSDIDRALDYIHAYSNTYATPTNLNIKALELDSEVIPERQQRLFLCRWKGDKIIEIRETPTDYQLDYIFKPELDYVGNTYLHLYAADLEEAQKKTLQILDENRRNAA